MTKVGEEFLNKHAILEAATSRTQFIDSAVGRSGCARPSMVGYVTDKYFSHTPSSLLTRDLTG